MQPRQPQMCRFGENCNKLAQGTCKFFHPPGQGGQGGQQGQQGQGPRGMNPNRNFNQPYDGPRRQNFPPNNYPDNNQGNFQQQQQQGWSGQHGQQFGKQFNQPQNMPPKTSD